MMDDLGLNYDNYSFDEYYGYEEGDICDPEEGVKLGEVFIPILYSVTFIVGILGNGLLLGVLIKRRKIWSVTDTFILHLAVADILLLVTLPFWVAESASGWLFGTLLCKITGSVFTINFYCGIFLLAFICMNWYLFIVHLTKMFMPKKPWVVHACCVVVWIFSLLFSIPDWIFLEDARNERRENKFKCIRNFYIFDLDAKTHKMVAQGLFHTFGFVLPSVVLIFCYSSILCKLWCFPKGLQKQRAFKTITAVVAVFFLCWTPFNITLMVDTFKPITSAGPGCARTALDIALTVTFALGVFHCCLNPILFILVDVKFRRQVLNMWKKTSESAVF
ncbi:hypothetical protein GOODEAATRI_005194 [Goodea atripinnis]|uniref:G-protein coupled receptors family 1 profile domain-containing protein n=1 Tax=Goodea atripinnis TaxID=208336 RepID=A0ABV0PLD4_9TELE